MLMLDDIRLATGLTPYRPWIRGRGWKPVSEILDQFREHHTPWELQVATHMLDVPITFDKATEQPSVPVRFRPIEVDDEQNFLPPSQFGVIRDQ